MPDLLTDAERSADLPALGAGGWGAVPDRDAIRKVWKFRNFVDAWGFMSRAALVAENTRIAQGTRQQQQCRFHAQSCRVSGARMRASHRHLRRWLAV
jgi:hypothetical protein